VSVVDHDRSHLSGVTSQSAVIMFVVEHDLELGSGESVKLDTTSSFDICESVFAFDNMASKNTSECGSIRS
jgi:hypothetical protein